MIEKHEHQLATLHRLLVEDPAYKPLVSAKTDADAVEGALWIDTHIAAELIRCEAKERKLSLGEEKLAPISVSLAVLIDRPIDWDTINAEAQKARLDMHGLLVSH